MANKHELRPGPLCLEFLCFQCVISKQRFEVLLFFNPCNSGTWHPNFYVFHVPVFSGPVFFSTSIYRNGPQFFQFPSSTSPAVGCDSSRVSNKTASKFQSSFYIRRACTMYSSCLASTPKLFCLASTSPVLSLCFFSTSQTPKGWNTKGKIEVKKKTDITVFLVIEKCKLGKIASVFLTFFFIFICYYHYSGTYGLT